MNTSYASMEEIQNNRKWVVIDATDQVLGRFAAQIASILKGKNKPYYVPHHDCGDHVIVINADKIRLTGRKADTKEYFRHTTTRPGSQRIISYKQMLASHPERVVEYAVKGMLPKNKLGADLFRNLKVVVGTEHDHEAQKPKAINLNDVN